MTIVPIGNVSLQVPDYGQSEFIPELIGHMHKTIEQAVSRMIDESLEAEITHFLERPAYKRRRKSQRKESKVCCSKCRSHRVRNFRRNGHYRRSLMTEWGIVTVNVPQLECQCGGNVRFVYETIRPRQRVWDDVKMEVQAEYGRGLSYRQIKLKLDQTLRSSVGLRTLNHCVLPLGQENGAVASWSKGEAPPVVRMDGIWITVMFSDGQTQTDRLGRRRVLKHSKRVPILAAQGVWPASGRTCLIGWMLVDGEDTLSWQKFMDKLFFAGLTPENGLCMLAADGSRGFRSAYESRYWQVPFQRCVFHKLRNMARALRPPANLDRDAARTFSTDFLRTASRIWQAETEHDARLCCTAFCQLWSAQQPKAIQVLSDDFESTLSFYSVQEQARLRGENWPAHLLRTTSPLERMFRDYRRRFRLALLFQSPTGAQASAAQLATRFS